MSAITFRVRVAHQPKHDRYPFAVERCVWGVWWYHDSYETVERATREAEDLVAQLDRKAKRPRIVREFA